MRSFRAFSWDRLLRTGLPVWAALVAASAAGAELNVLSDLKVAPSKDGARIVIAGARAPTFTVFRLSGPDRLVVDVSSADASRIKGPHEGHGPISGVVVSQFADEKASVARVLVALEAARNYDVRAEGKQVLISVDGLAAEAAPVAAAAPAEAPVDAPAVEPAAVAAAPAEAAPAPQAEPTPAAALAEERLADPKLPPNVIASRMDEREVKNPAQKITAFRFQRDTLKLRTDGEVAKYEIIELADPPRLALDVYGVSASARAPKIKSAHLADVRVGAHADKVRLVLEMKGEMPAYRVERSITGIELLLGQAAVAQAKKAQPKVEVAESSEAVIEIDGKKFSPEAAAVESAPLVASAAAELKDLSFEESPAGGKVELKLTGKVSWRVDQPDPRSAVLTLDNARVRRELERSLDTHALDTPVRMISTFSLPGPGHKVRIVVAADGTLEEKLTETATGLSWRLSVKETKVESEKVASKVAGFSAEAPAYVAEGAPKQRRFTGKRVSFEFKDIDIHNLLRVIAEVSKKNVVVADDVSGKVTIRLRNVPWDQALELILRSKGLGKEEFGNILRVAPLKTLEEESATRAKRAESMRKQEELVVQLIPVNYAAAGDMQARVKEVLTERGNVTVDARTNVLIIRDVVSNISKARSLVANLDTATPQVLIESRIVEASTSFSRQVGVQWGGQVQASPGAGNATGLIFPNVVSVRGGSSSEANAGTAADPNFAVNLPAAVGTGSGGALGFIFGSAGGAAALNLRLSALENEGQVKTISSPKVTTLDNNTARISQGVSIPFSQVSASGVNTSFVEARLSLEVTPHITQDGSVLMAIKAENNQPDPSNSGANGQPAIQKKEANTQVMVKDGETTVIGGIYVRRGAQSTAAVPLLSRLPVIGFFFKNTTESDARQELLIFITPRIINRQTVAQTL